MAIHDLSGWQHSHSFDPGNRAGERGSVAEMNFQLLPKSVDTQMPLR